MGFVAEIISRCCFDHAGIQTDLDSLVFKIPCCLFSRASVETSRYEDDSIFSHGGFAVIRWNRFLTANDFDFGGFAVIRWNRFLTAYDFDFVGDLLGSDFELIVVPFDGT